MGFANSGNPFTAPRATINNCCGITPNAIKDEINGTNTGTTVIGDPVARNLADGIINSARSYHQATNNSLPSGIFQEALTKNSLPVMLGIINKFPDHIHRENFHKIMQTYYRFSLREDADLAQVYLAAQILLAKIRDDAKFIINFWNHTLFVTESEPDYVRFVMRAWDREIPLCQDKWSFRPTRAMAAYITYSRAHAPRHLMCETLAKRAFPTCGKVPPVIYRYLDEDDKIRILVQKSSDPILDYVAEIMMWRLESVNIEINFDDFNDRYHGLIKKIMENITHANQLFISEFLLSRRLHHPMEFVRVIKTEKFDYSQIECLTSLLIASISKEKRFLEPNRHLVSTILHNHLAHEQIKNAIMLILQVNKPILSGKNLSKVVRHALDNENTDLLDYLYRVYGLECCYGWTCDPNLFPESERTQHGEYYYLTEKYMSCTQFDRLFSQ